ncbi:hypothetical protein QFZ24_000606 [Streptomyces phaeochromogenes]|nr:hypothetical protein [Streptomyces phaeochromogenes]
MTAELFSDGPPRGTKPADLFDRRAGGPESVNSTSCRSN